jgi:hypothetical protein
VENPHHCGGQGGCEGATYNLGFEWVQEHGLYTEWEYPYASFIGEIPACDNGTIYPLAAITGYAHVPSNYGLISVGRKTREGLFRKRGVFSKQGTPFCK